MDETARRFVERMGLLCERDGMARTAGRIFGWLLYTGETCSLDELAAGLRVSKASVSTNARLLEQIGLLERTSTPGDRRDFYRIGADPWTRMLRGAQARWRDTLVALRHAMEDAPGAPDRGRCLLGEAAGFHELLLRESETLLEEWARTRAAARASRMNPVPEEAA